jgi:hypothetical protein
LLLRHTGFYWLTMLNDCFRYYKGCELWQKFVDVQLSPWRTEGWPKAGERESNKILYKNWPICPKFKIMGNLYARRWWMHFPIVEKWCQQNYEASRRIMWLIRSTVSKLCSKQSLKVKPKMLVQTSLPLTWTSPLGIVLDLSSNRPSLVRSYWNYAQFWFKIEPFLPNLDSWVARHKIEWNFNTRVTSTQETSFQRGSSQIQRFPFQF